MVSVASCQLSFLQEKAEAIVHNDVNLYKRSSRYHDVQLRAPAFVASSSGEQVKASLFPGFHIAFLILRGRGLVRTLKFRVLSRCLASLKPDLAKFISKLLSSFISAKGIGRAGLEPLNSGSCVNCCTNEQPQQAKFISKLFHCFLALPGPNVIQRLRA